MNLIEKIRQLPPDKREILERIVDSMIEERKPLKKPKFDWFGKARDLNHDGVYWQHKVREWRERDVSD